MLEESPLDVDRMGIRDIRLWGTVVGGVPFEAAHRVMDPIAVTVIGGYLFARPRFRSNQVLRWRTAVGSLCWSTTTSVNIGSPAI